MRKYKPKKNALMILVFIVLVITLGINIALLILKKFIPFSVEFILFPVYILAFIIVFILLPAYFGKAYFTVNSKEIRINSGFFSTVNTIIPMSSIKSITQIILPLSRFTGMNFIVLNTLGSKAVIMFVSKNDMREVSSIIERALINRTPKS